ncbi:MAG: DUF481 domain-containing protein [Thiohalocapsa sp.]|nr:DUF481 domain-containing protein [Thiohalocapsa sp.]
MAIALLCAQPVLADELIMTNGDRLSGHVLAADDGGVTLQTDYAGVILVQRAKIGTLRYGAVAPAPESAPASAGPQTAHAGAQSDTTPAPDAGAAGITNNSPMALADLSAPASPYTAGTDLSGRINLALTSDKGNSQQNDLNLDYRVELRHGWNRIDSHGELAVDTTGGVRSVDKWSSYSGYSRHFPSSWYAAAVLGLRHDRFADLRLRSIVGPMLGYPVAEGDALTLSLEAGPVRLHEDFYDQPARSSWGPAWFLNYDQSVWHEQLRLYHREFGYVAADTANKRLWQAWTGMSVPLTKGFVGSIEFEYDYDSDPAVAAKTTDTALRVKLGYEW